jgi:hypothetical protein
VSRAASPAQGVPRAPTPVQGVSRAASPAQGVPRAPTPSQGVPRAQTPSPAARTTGSPPRGFARALTPPLDRKRPASSPPPPPPRRVGGPEIRTPSDPEIETYLEIEADLPPEPGFEHDLEHELALRRALGGDADLGRAQSGVQSGGAEPRLARRVPDDDEEHESVSIVIEEEGRRVIETTTESEGHTLTVTVTEPYFDERPRAITAEDGHEVSGSISIPEDTPPPPPPRKRARRQSSGWDD